MRWRRCSTIWTTTFASARDLLATMLAQRDQWLHFLGRSDAFDASQQQSLRRRLEAALALSVEEELELIRAHMPLR